MEKEGELLIKFARKAVENYFENKIFKPKNFPKELAEKKGVFVSIKKGSELKGCIGFPLPTKPLILATIQAAINAAFYDLRFEPLKKEELDKVIFEVSILTEPKLVEVSKPDEYLKKIKIGKDGIIVEKDLNSGLLLPQVAIEYNFNEKEFLEHACLKAGLPKNAWLSEKIKVYTFQAEIFKEIEPNGKVVKWN